MVTAKAKKRRSADRDATAASSTAEPTEASTAMPTACPWVAPPGTIGIRSRRKLLCFALALRRVASSWRDAWVRDTLEKLRGYFTEQYCLSESHGKYRPGLAVKDLYVMRLSKGGRAAVQTGDGLCVAYMSPALDPSTLPLRLVFTLSRDPVHAAKRTALPATPKLTVVFNNLADRDNICVTQCCAPGVYEYTMYVNGYRLSQAPPGATDSSVKGTASDPATFQNWPATFLRSKKRLGIRVELYSTHTGTCVELLGWGWGLREATPEAASAPNGQPSGEDGKARLPKVNELHPAKLADADEESSVKAREANSAKIGQMNADRDAWWGAGGTEPGAPLPSPRSRTLLGAGDSRVQPLNLTCPPASTSTANTGTSSPRTPPSSPPADAKYHFDSNEATCMGCGVKRDRSTLRQCPECLKLDMLTYFCSQACFKAAWATHKKVHQPQGIFELMKHPEQRFQSFKTWPYNYAFANPRTLAESGYFFQPTLEYPDRCICYKCRGDIRNWCNKSIPWLLHKKFKKDCVLVREKFGGGLQHAGDWRCKNKHCLYVNSGAHCCCAVCYKVLHEKEGHTDACPHKAKSCSAFEPHPAKPYATQQVGAGGKGEAVHTHSVQAPNACRPHPAATGPPPVGTGKGFKGAAQRTHPQPPPRDRQDERDGDRYSYVSRDDVTLLRKGSRVLLQPQGGNGALQHDVSHSDDVEGHDDAVYYVPRTGKGANPDAPQQHGEHAQALHCAKHANLLHGGHFGDVHPAVHRQGAVSQTHVCYQPPRRTKRKRRSKGGQDEPATQCSTERCGYTQAPNGTCTMCDWVSDGGDFAGVAQTGQTSSDPAQRTAARVDGNSEDQRRVDEYVYCGSQQGPNIRLLVVDTTGREIRFMLPRRVPLRNLTDAYCRRENCERRSVRFLFDSSILNDSKSAEELHMEENDVIDVMGSELPNDSHHWHLLPTSDIPILEEVHQALPEARRQEAFKERTTLLALWPSGEYVNKPQMVLTRKRCPVFFTQPITGRRLRITLQLPKPEAVYIPQIRVEARTEEQIRDVFLVLVSILQAAMEGKCQSVSADNPKYKALTSENGKFLASPINMLQSVGFYRFGDTGNATYVIRGDALERDLCHDFKRALEDELAVLQRDDGAAAEVDKPSFQSKLRVYAATVLEEVGALKEALEEEAPNVLLLSRCKQAWASAAVYWYFEHYSILQSSHRNLATQIFDAATQLLCAVYDFLNPQTEEERFARDFDDESSTYSSTMSSLRSPPPYHLAAPLLAPPPHPLPDAAASGVSRYPARLYVSNPAPPPAVPPLHVPGRQASPEAAAAAQPAQLYAYAAPTTLTGAAYPAALYGARRWTQATDFLMTNAMVNCLYDPVSGLTVPMAGAEPLHVLGDPASAQHASRRRARRMQEPWSYWCSQAKCLRGRDPKASDALGHLVQPLGAPSSVDERYYACSYLTQYYSLNASCAEGGAEERDESEYAGHPDACGGAGGGDRHAAHVHDPAASGHVSHSALSSCHSSGIAGGAIEYPFHYAGAGGGDLLAPRAALMHPLVLGDHDAPLPGAPLDVDVLYRRVRSGSVCKGHGGNGCPHGSAVAAPVADEAEKAEHAQPSAPLPYPHNLYSTAATPAARPGKADDTGSGLCEYCTAAGQYPFELYARGDASIANFWGLVQVVRGVRACSAMLGDVLCHSDDELDTDSEEFTVAGSDSCLRELSDTDVDMETVSVTDFVRGHHVINAAEARTTIPGLLTAMAGAVAAGRAREQVHDRQTGAATLVLAVVGACVARTAALKLLHFRALDQEEEGRECLLLLEEEGRAAIHSSVRSAERAYQKRLRDEKRQRAAAAAEEERSRGAVENEERNKRQQLVGSFEQVLAKRKAALQAWAKKWKAVQPEEQKARQTIATAESKASFRIVQEMESGGRRCVASLQTKEWQRLGPQLKALGKVLKQSHKLFLLEAPARTALLHAEHAAYDALARSKVADQEAVVRATLMTDEASAGGAFGAEAAAAQAAVAARVNARVAKEEEAARRQQEAELKTLEDAAAAAAAEVERAAAVAASEKPSDSTSALPPPLGAMNLEGPPTLLSTPVTPQSAPGAAPVPAGAQKVLPGAAQVHRADSAGGADESEGTPSGVEQDTAQFTPSSSTHRPSSSTQPVVFDTSQYSPSSSTHRSPPGASARSSVTRTVAFSAAEPDSAPSAAQTDEVEVAALLGLLGDEGALGKKDPSLSPAKGRATGTPTSSPQELSTVVTATGSSRQEEEEEEEEEGMPGTGLLDGMFDSLRHLDPTPRQTDDAATDDDIPLPALLKALSQAYEPAPSRDIDQDPSPQPAHAPFSSSQPEWLAPGAALRAGAAKPNTVPGDGFSPFDSFYSLMAPRPVARDAVQDDDVKRLTKELVDAGVCIKKQQRQIEELMKRNDSLAKDNERLSQMMKQPPMGGPFVRVHGTPQGPNHGFGQGTPAMFEALQHVGMEYPPGMPYGAGMPFDPFFQARHNFST